MAPEHTAGGPLSVSILPDKTADTFLRPSLHSPSVVAHLRCSRLSFPDLPPLLHKLLPFQPISISLISLASLPLCSLFCEPERRGRLGFSPLQTGLYIRLSPSQRPRLRRGQVAHEPAAFSPGHRRLNVSNLPGSQCFILYCFKVCGLCYTSFHA